MQNILLLHPGEMGTSIGASLVGNGFDIIWVSEGRSADTAARATKNGFKSAKTLNDALPSADAILSICPPEHALRLAGKVAKCGYQHIYVDGNAVSPETSLRIADLFGDQYVDGGIIGPPAWQENSTRFYLSGLGADKIAILFEGTMVQAKTISEVPGEASALKMAFAAYTKGSSALLLAVVALAKHYGVAESLSNEWKQSIPSLGAQAEGSARGTSGKAWRFIGEMQEIEQTFRDAGLPGGFHHAAAEIYRRLEIFKNDPQELNDVISQLLANSES